MPKNVGMDSLCSHPWRLGAYKRALKGHQYDTCYQKKYRKQSLEKYGTKSKSWGLPISIRGVAKPLVHVLKLIHMSLSSTSFGPFQDIKLV